MRFWEAMKALEEGKKVRCVCWAPTSYLLLEGQRIRHSLRLTPELGPVYYSLPADLTISWELYEEPGHDWNWAKTQLRRFTHIKRKGWVDQKLVYHTNHLLYIRTGELEAPYIANLDDQDATDWILA